MTSMRLHCIGAYLLILGIQSAYAQELPSFELKDGDRVVFVGDGFFERAQRYGHMEAALTTLWPDRFYTFRNIGWYGDTVFGEARDHYTNPPTAYEHLIEQVTTNDPTVLFISYGANLAFEDERAFEAFREGYGTLLDDLDASARRCVLLTPLPHEQDTSPHPDVTAFNDNLEQASELIADIASERGCYFIDLYSNFYGLFTFGEFMMRPEPITSNGIHLSGFGYTLATQWLLEKMEAPHSLDSLLIDLTDEDDFLTYSKDGDTYTFTLNPEYAAYNGTRVLRIKGLKKGTYMLSDASGELGTSDHKNWEMGRLVRFSVDQHRAEELRKEIIEKNILYFRKYRPQNETYLVGFRKYEQGQNAVELELLDPLIGEKENSIGRLKQPVPLTFTLERL